MSAKLIRTICSCLEIIVDGRKNENSTDSKKEKTNLLSEVENKYILVFNKIHRNEDLLADVNRYIQPNAKEFNFMDYIALCLVLLKLLHDALANDTEETPSSSTSPMQKKPSGLLSISQEKTVRKFLQHIICFGIWPYLLPGVIITPVKNGPDNSDVLKKMEQVFTFQQRHRCLVTCVEVLVDCLDQPALQNVILAYYSGDLLSGLLQLCYAPVKEELKNTILTQKCNDMPTKDIKSLGVGMTTKNNFRGMLKRLKDSTSFQMIDLVHEMLQDRNYLKSCFAKLLKSTSRPLLMWELLYFHGESPKSTKIPLWLRKQCNFILTDMMFKPHGIANFLEGVLGRSLDYDLHSKVDNQKLEKIACLISCNPVKHVPFSVYTEKIAEQVIDLLHESTTKLDDLLSYIASSVILQYCKLYVDLAKKHFLSIIFKPIEKCISTDTSDLPSDTVITEEEELSILIEDAYKVFVSTHVVSTGTCVKLLFPYFSFLCNMFYLMYSGKCYLRHKLKNLLYTILSSAEPEEAVELLKVATFFNEGLNVHPCNVDFAFNDSGGIIAIPKKEEIVIETDNQCYAILELLQEISDKKIKVSYFLLLLKELTKHKIKQEDNLCGVIRLKHCILSLCLLHEMIERYSEILIEDISQAIDFIVALLENVNDSTIQDENPFYSEESLTVALIILSSFIECRDQLNSEQWMAVKKSIPSLQKLQNCSHDPFIQNMAENMCIQIATRGAAGKNMISEIRNRKYGNESVAPKIEIQCEKHSKYTVEETSQQSCKENEATGVSKLNESLSELSFSVDSIREMKDMMNLIDDEQSSEDSVAFSKTPVHEQDKTCTAYENAMKHLADSILPFRGHGLIVLRKLIKSRDEETLSHKKDLLRLFQDNLADEDSYIYLSAISGLSSLADVDVELVLPVVLEKFQNPDEYSCELVLKLGEVLQKITRLLGEMVYKYKNQLLHVFLLGAKHKEPQVRSSSLSNLGETCMQMKFDINGAFLQEILLCVQSLLKTDKDLEVRRCAVMVIRLLLQGLGKDALMVLESNLKDIYSQLKIVYNGADDDVLRLHSQITLEEINLIIKESLFKKHALEKKIHIF